MTTTVLETCRIQPTPAAGNTSDELSVPLSFLDMLWLHYHPIRRLLFYEHPNCSKYHFSDTLVPKLKQSLSITLKHYLPVAGNLLYPSIPEKKPVIRYRSGDAVSLTIAESGDDFDELIGNHARDADQFYDFVPRLPHLEDEAEPDCKIVPVFALQVTLFPGRGICIGFANHHCLGDGSSIVGFIWAWAEISKLGGDDEFLIKKGESSLPIFDRSVLNDTLGIDTIYWKVMGQMPFRASSFPLPTNRVRATYILHQADIKKLKELVLEKKPSLIQVSSFVVTVSYIWTCLVKSEEVVGEEVDGDVLESLIFAVDARARINPPAPSNYFGNCLGYGLAQIERKELVHGGYLIAAEAIAEEIKNRVNKKGELLKGAENWMSEMTKSMGMKAVGVSGSPKFDLTSADFGWGTAEKLEVLSLDGEKYSMSLCKSRDFEGGLEVGLSLPKERMEAFAAIFADGLKI